MKRWVTLFVILYSSHVNGKSFEYGDYVANLSGFLTYTYSTNPVIVPEHDYSAIINTTVSNTHGYVSGQFSSNRYNPIRRLMLDVPIYVQGCTQVDIAIGRLTNSIGFINTNLHNSQVNGSVLLPLSTYDPRRYENLPDITDGGQVNYTVNLEHFNIKLKGYAGKQVIDNPVIDVYGSNFSLIGKSDLMYGFDIKAVYDNNTTLHYAFTSNEGTVQTTKPPYYINNITKRLSQNIHFIGFQHFIDEFKIQGEATYRQLNIVTDEIGGNLSVSYNFKDKWNYYVGSSYGVRTNDTSKMFDVYTGISNTVNDITMSLELHNVSLNNWFFEYHQPEKKNIPIALFSITYSF